MAIRQRLVKSFPKPEYREGHPDWLFEGFRLRFGHVVAVFTNAKMQANAGLADRSLIRKPGPAATIYFVYNTQIDSLIAERQANGLNTADLIKARDCWPTSHKIPRELRNRIAHEE